MRIVETNENYVAFDQRRVGLEFENPLTTRSGDVVDGEMVQALHTRLKKNGWTGEPDPMTKKILSVDKLFHGRNANISTDCGLPTLEMAMPPQENLHDAAQVLGDVYADVLGALQGIDARLLGIGAVPGWTSAAEKYKTEKPVNLLKEKLWMHNIFVPLNAHQVGVSVRLDEAIDIVNQLTQVCGLAVALCGNSSISNFQTLSWKDWRMAAYEYLLLSSDNKEAPKIFSIADRPFTSIADHFSYFWGVDFIPLLGPIRDGRFGRLPENVGWLSFLKGGEREGYYIAGEDTTYTPQASDLGTTFTYWPHAKFKLIFDTDKIDLAEFLEALEADDLESYLPGKYTNCYIEFRPAATAPIGEEMAVPALALGLVENLEALKKLTQKKTWTQWKELVLSAAVVGLDAKVDGDDCLPYVQEMVDIAKVGLEKRGLGEEKYLDPLYKRIEKKQNPADMMNALLREKGKEGFLDAITYT